VSVTRCKLCNKPCLNWQVYCGAACCAAWEMGIRSRFRTCDECERNEAEDVANGYDGITVRSDGTWLCKECTDAQKRPTSEE
jgi:hypothetical protein